VVRKQQQMKLRRADLAPRDALTMCSLLHTAKQAVLSKLLKRIWMALFPSFQKAKVFRSGYVMTPKLTPVREGTAAGQPQRGIAARLEKDRLPTAPGSIQGFQLLITYCIKQLDASYWKTQKTLSKDGKTCMERKAELASFLSLLTLICPMDFLAHCC